MTVYGSVLNVLPYFEILGLRSSHSVYFENAWLLLIGQARAWCSCDICFSLFRREIVLANGRKEDLEGQGLLLWSG